MASEVLLVLQILGGAMLLETNLAALVLQAKALIKATQKPHKLRKSFSLSLTHY